MASKEISASWNADMFGAVDEPLSGALRTGDRVSGWCMSRDGRVADRLCIALGGEPAFSLRRSLRSDVAAHYPGFGRAQWSGFTGEAIIPASATVRHLCDARLLVTFGRETRVACAWEAELAPEQDSVNPEVRSILSKTLVDPDSGIPFAKHVHYGAHRQHGTYRGVHRGCVHFHYPGTAPLIQLAIASPAHAYSPRMHQLIGTIPADRVFLDLGCGVRPTQDLYQNGIYLDAVQFRGVDVACTSPALPFADNTFELVISAAVFEHVEDPVSLAGEVLRVLRPGGKFLIDTAFMQPFHGDPDHYFNMTRSGLAKILQGFDIDELGVEPYQLPSWGLRMQVASVRPYLSPGAWSDFMDEFERRLLADGEALDAALGELGQETLAAGFYALAKKAD